MKHKGLSGRNAFLLLLAAIGCVMLALNVHTPLMMDDYDYSFSWATGGRLAGVADIIASQAAHYAMWGGRSVTHFLAQLFLYLGKPVFNVANTLAYLGLLVEICLLGRKRGEAPDWRMLLAAHALLVFLVPFFGVVFLWLDGACNYLWGTALALLPLLIIKSEREGGFFDTDGPRGLFAVPLCFIAGWTNENTACGVLAAAVLLLAYDVWTKRKIRAWRVAAAAAQALGVAVMLLAPGNFARSAGAESGGMLADLLYGFAVVSYCLLRYVGVLALLILALLVICRRRRVMPDVQWIWVLGAGAFFSAYALAASPQISDRTFTGVIALAAAFLLSLAGSLKGGMRVNKGSAAAGVIALAVLLVGSAGAMRSVCAHEAAWLEQVEKIEAAAAAGEESVTVTSVPSSSMYTMSVVIEKDASAWPNSTLSKYYGIRVMGE